LPYIQFLGAAGTVTGSKHLINTAHDSGGKQGFQVLIDCGLFQGPKAWRERNWQDTPVPAREIDAVILTHAHLDHCGWIPRLVKEGFRGPIYATQPTIDLCSVVLPDSGHLQEEDAAYYNKRKVSKHDPALPLYTLKEAQDCQHFFKPVTVEQTTQLSPELSFRFVRAAHILDPAWWKSRCRPTSAVAGSSSPAMLAACATARLRPAKSCIPGRKKTRLPTCWSWSPRTATGSIRTPIPVPNLPA
jgi:metallo-beta-lactamase family protein